MLHRALQYLSRSLVYDLSDPSKSQSLICFISLHLGTSSQCTRAHISSVQRLPATDAGVRRGIRYRSTETHNRLSQERLTDTLSGVKILAGCSRARDAYAKCARHHCFLPSLSGSPAEHVVYAGRSCPRSRSCSCDPHRSSFRGLGCQAIEFELATNTVFTSSKSSLVSEVQHSLLVVGHQPHEGFGLLFFSQSFPIVDLFASIFGVDTLSREEEAILSFRGQRVSRSAVALIHFTYTTLDPKLLPSFLLRSLISPNLIRNHSGPLSGSRIRQDASSHLRGSDCGSMHAPSQDHDSKGQCTAIYVPGTLERRSSRGSRKTSEDSAD